MQTLKKILFWAVLWSMTSCAYYNTFFNAKRYFEQAGAKKEALTEDVKNLPKDIRNGYLKAIEKSWKVINVYGDSSRWADDALFLIGKSHYELEEYDKAEKIFEQFKQKYVRSEWLPRVQIWLGKTYMQQEKRDKALDIFSSLLSGEQEEAIQAEAHLYMGHIYFNSETYDEAIAHYQKVMELGDEERLLTEALNYMAEAHYALGAYDKAIENYQEILKYDQPVAKRYDAFSKLIDALIEKKDYDNAARIMKNALTDQRFKDYFSLIEVKIANLSEFRNEKDYALELYREVMKKYPRTNGSALAAYYMGQIYELDYGRMDSAKTMYDKVKREFAKSEAVKDAAERSRTLSVYLKIHKQLLKDREDLYKLEHGDSSLVDSLVTGLDTVEITVHTDTDSSQNNNHPNDPSAPAAANNSAQPGDKTSSKANKSSGMRKKVKEKKKAVNRKPEDVQLSLKRNSYNLGEFFLLTYDRPDSAVRAYQHFIEQFPDDSVLTPKAYYSLYTAYKELDDSLNARIYKQRLMEHYPESIYSLKLSGAYKPKAAKENSKFHKDYLLAEDAMDKGHYRQAIDLFTQIAESDSGDTWGKKARYSIAWIYEHKLNDISKAVEAYSIFAREYPTSREARLALGKSTLPKIETDSTAVVGDSSRALPSAGQTKHNIKEPARKAKEPALKKDPENKEPHPDDE
ncbi:MAG: tetratricopeptide repeat protein [Calditrichaeota bacterium]|nr:MAG: tetratricopeptide repeat protein [Calditrichota bacterium]